MDRVRAALLASPLACLFACSGGPGIVPGARGPSLDVAAPPPGVPDPQADPSVVAIEVGGIVLCSGALVATDVVVTARRCVDNLAPAATGRQACPPGSAQPLAPRSPSDLRILVGDDVSTAVERARGYELIEPSGTEVCGADLAFVVLDSAIDDRVPLSVRPTTAARGDRLRTVGFDRAHKLVRDHVEVVDVATTELLLEEAPGRAWPGGPAIDETTGELVGVLSRADATSDAAAVDVYTRLDVAPMLLEQALAFGQVRSAAHAVREKKGPVDMGANCVRGADCASGVCLTYEGSRYCSRGCGPHDKCPPRFKCMQSVEGGMACVES